MLDRPIDLLCGSKPGICWIDSGTNCLLRSSALDLFRHSIARFGADYFKLIRLVLSKRKPTISEKTDKPESRNLYGLLGSKFDEIQPTLLNWRCSGAIAVMLLQAVWRAY
jgi:hypothetical protein